MDNSESDASVKTSQTRPVLKFTLWKKGLLKNLPVILLLAVFSAVSFYLGARLNQPTYLTEEPAMVEDSTPTLARQNPEPLPQDTVEPTVTVFPGGFQDILLRNCQIVTLSYDSTKYNVIDYRRAPFTISPNLLDINYQIKDSFSCGINDTGIPNGFFYIKLQDNSGIHIYDKNTVELGHGGAPYIGSFGTVIGDDGKIKLSVYIAGSDGPTFISFASVWMRGEKRLRLNNGDEFFANYSAPAIYGKDTRLMDFLTPYSKPSVSDPSERELTKFPTEELKSRFFSDLTNLQSPEKEALDKIERVLGAVAAK